jgi:hypothetical protein
MRRAVPLALLAIAIALAGCNSSATTKKTTTVVHTVTGTAVASGTQKSGTVVVVPPSTPTSKSTTTVASTTKRTTVPPKKTTAAQTAAPIIKLDPLKADCLTLLDAADVKKAIGAAVAEGSTKKKDVANPSRGITGKIRCYYPKPDAKGTAPVVIALTQYSSAAAATKQLKVTVEAEEEKGAKVSAPKINGYPGHVLLRQGGLVNLQYGTWTLAIAVADKLASDATLTKGLPTLAGQVLTRIIKNR